MKPPPALLAGARELLTFSPGRALSSLVLLLAAGITEGVSLLVFAPALHLLEDGAGNGGVVAHALTAAGIPYELGPVLLLCLALVAARASLVYFKNRCTARLHIDFADHLRERTYAALGNAQWSVTSTLRSADVEELITTGIDRVQSGIWALVLLVQAAILFVVYLGLSALASLPLTLLVGCAGIALMVALRGQRARAAALGVQVTRDRQAAFRELSTMVAGLRVTKSFGSEQVQEERFARSVADTRAGYTRYADLSALGGLYFQLAAGSLLAAAVYLGARTLALDLPTLLILIFCVARLAPYLSQLHNFAQQVLFALPAWEQLQRLRTTLEEAREPEASTSQHFTMQHQLVIDQLCFRYPGKRELALDNISLVLPAGTCTALLGVSGAGKSTLADVLLGLIPALSGSIHIDGQLLAPQSAKAWRRRVGYVPQETFLLPASVRDNLRLGDPQASDEDLWRVLDMSAATDFVRALPGRLEAQVGERGSRLSGGERQRLALARALLRKPLLLVLDEATAALDTANQHRIGEALRQLRGQVTTLLITHRHAMARLADQVVHLHAGRIGGMTQGLPDDSAAEAAEAVAP